MMLADPRFVIVQPVEVFEQFEVALDRQGRVFVVIVERRQEDAAAHIEIVHAESSGGSGGWRALLPSSAIAAGHRKRFRDTAAMLRTGNCRNWRRCPRRRRAG